MRYVGMGDSAKTLLDAFASQLVANDQNFPLPGSRYVGAGEIPWDGEGLYVYLAGGFTGQPGQPVATNIVSVNAMTYAVSFYVMLVRGVSSFGYWNSDGLAIPDDVNLEAEGIQAVNDAGALVQAAIDIKDSGLIVRNGQTGFVIGQVTPVGPQGGLAAMRLQLDLSVDGS